MSWSGSSVESAPPRFAVPATDRASFGPALGEVAEALGWSLLPWQETVARTALEHVGGKLQYRDVAVGTPRQSGKSSLVLSLIVFRMVSAPNQRIVYSAQTRLAARTKLFDTWFSRVRRSALGSMFSLSRATGAETLRCSNGSTLSLLSTEESGGHGETVDLGIADEAWALDASVEQSIRPAMSTRPNAQMWSLSTAGTEKSLFWRSKVDQGRTAATLGVTDGLAYFEWSAADDCDVTDPASWPTFHPAINFTIDPETIRADFQAMPLPQFRRAYANQWGDETGDGWQVIPQDIWERAQL
jgi:phage terminase large subunit-like protein